MTTPFNNTTPPKDNQDAFDRACERLLTHFELGRSVIVRGPMISDACVYRAYDHRGSIKNCCVVGYMIPDWPELLVNGNPLVCSVISMRRAIKDSIIWFSAVDPLLLSQLQQVHDVESAWDSPAIMYQRLVEVADRWKLKVQPKFLKFNEQSPQEKAGFPGPEIQSSVPDSAPQAEHQQAGEHAQPDASTDTDPVN